MSVHVDINATLRTSCNMTVIFHTNAGSPVLAGDMLISTVGSKPFTDLKLPSHPNGVVIPTNPIPGRVPIKMRRKIFIINEHLAVGAAGDVMSIQNFINDLFQAFRNKPHFASGEVKDYLNQYGSSPIGRGVFREIGFVVLVEATDWRGSLTRAQTVGTDFVSARFGKVIAIGTGSNRIIDKIQELDRYETGLTQPDGGDENFPEFRRLGPNLVLLANVYWDEFMSPDHVFQAWGGAYDLIYQDTGNVFRYLDDYTMILRLFDVEQADRGIQLMNVLKYSRLPDVSYISMVTDKGLDFFGAKDITASEVPVTIPVRKDEFTMNSKFHISMVAVGKGNRFAPPLVQIEGIQADDQSNPTAFTWFDEQGRLCTWFNSKHDEWLEEQAMILYSKYADRLG